MINFFKKVGPLFRTIFLLICAVGVLILVSQKDFAIQVLSIIPVGGFIFIMVIDNMIKNKENEEKVKKEYKEKHEIKKMPFDEVKEGYILKWSYYNEQIAGTRYLNIDYSKLKCGDELRLEKDPLNAHDKNAIKVYYKEMHIGFIHKNYIQEMFNKYSVDETFRIYVRLNSINEAEKRLSLEIGFYKRFEKKDYPILAIYKCAIYDTDKYLSNWDKVSNNEYVSIDLNDTAYVVSEGKSLGTLKYNECKYLYTLSGDFRYVGKIYSLDKKDNSVVGRVEIYVIKL